MKNTNNYVFIAMIAVFNAVFAMLEIRIKLCQGDDM